MKIPISQTIRAQYPHPRTVSDGAKGHDLCGYCVGGAFIYYYSMATWLVLRHGFPGGHDLARGLQEKNPALDWKQANRYAWKIIKHNDDQDFDGAWHTLDLALSYRQRAPKRKA